MAISRSIHKIRPTLDIVGASLLAMVCQSTLMPLTHHREPARSYKGSVFTFDISSGAIHDSAAPRRDYRR
jgi:hypothetical protein